MPVMPSGYWQEMSALNRESQSVLTQNESLQNRLKDLNQQMNAKDTELYNLETRLENLDIFEQHLTSLNLRCEFLDKQVTNLESKQKVSPPLFNTNLHLAKMRATPGLKGFKDRSCLNIEWRTTETTFENLCTEFKYLKEQLTIANNHIQLDSSHDDSLLSHSSTNRSTSLFSETEIPSMDDACSSLVISTSKEDQFTSNFANTDLNPQAKKKKLLKMESFLNFAETENNNKETNKDKESHNIGPLRGFNINTIHDNPLFESNSLTHLDGEENIPKPELPLGRKAPTKPIKKKLELISLPCITEENQSLCEVNNCVDQENITFEHHNPVLNKNNGYKEISILHDQKSHRRHSSLPETSSLDGNNLILASDESIRHFMSHETGLNSKYANHKKFNISDFLFVEPNEPRNKSGPNTMDQLELRDPCMISSSPFSTFKASYIDDESFYGGSEDNNKFSTQCVNSLHIDSDSDSDESYGDENATPLILKKESRLSLYKCKSHESIFSAMTKHTKDFPMRERNLDLKAQTMKWLKPNNPTVSFSTQPFITSNNVAFKNNAHDDIINILHSGANLGTELDPQTPTGIRSESPEKSIPSNTFSSPMPIKSIGSEEFNNNSDGISSWFSNFIPNSAFTNPEVGKLIGQPSAKSLDVKGGLSRSRGKPTSFTLTPINFRKVRANINGPSSSLIINKNGERIISHGYGSSFNNSVISSRISHGALRDALESEII